ncbi:ParB family protein [Escherichia coli]
MKKEGRYRGIAVKRDGVYLLIEGSRRRFCCIKAEKDLPLWVLPDQLTEDDINSIISAAQTSRKFSYREVGFQFIKKMEEKGFSTNEELAAYLGISHVSVAKESRPVLTKHSSLLFPDYEGIPNSYYSRLSRLQKYVQKNLFPLDEVIDNVKEETKDLDIGDLQVAQKVVMEKITQSVESVCEKSYSTKWETSDSITFDNKDKYARISKNNTGRKIRIEFNRISAGFIKELEEFIKEKLKVSE